MADTGWISPGTIQNISWGDFAWRNPTNAGLSDDNYADTIGYELSTSDKLACSNFGLAIPSATINGIEVKIERKARGVSDTILDYTLNIVKGGVVYTTVNKADRSNQWPISDTEKNYGGSTDLWGLSWTSGDINASNFGLQFRIEGAGAETDSTYNALVDSIQVKVYYTEVVSSPVKSINGLALASIKSENGLAVASIKSYNGIV